MNAPIHFADDRSSTVQARYRCRPAKVLSVREVLAEPEAVVDWKLVHDRIVSLGAARAAREHELCRWLRAAERLGVHARMGFASLREYAERTLGLRPRQLEERLRVARALTTLPALDRALAQGELCWSTVRELSRVATSDTEGAWRRWADGRRLREIEQTVATHHPGERPESRPDPSLVRHRLRFEVRAETMALFRDLEARVRADLGCESGAEADDDMVLHEIARRALGGPDDEGRASYQVAVSRCPECMRTSIEAGGHSHEVDAAVSEMMACDFQDVGEVDVPHVGSGRAGAATMADEGTRSPHTGAPREARLAARPRATQTIPPATRRAVMRRDRGHCVVPGCANHRWLDVHHVVPRAEGGSHDAELLACICGSHHKRIHDGSLVIEGAASRGFTFRHADGSVYGDRPSPAALELTGQVLGALEHLGFGASRARALVDEVRKQGAPEGVAAFLRAALVLA